MKLIMISTIFSLTVFDRSEGTQDQGKHKIILVNQNLEMQNIQKLSSAHIQHFSFTLLKDKIRKFSKVTSYLTKR